MRLPLSLFPSWWSTHWRRYRLRWLQVLIVLGVLALSLLFGYRPPLSPFYMAAGLGAFFLGLLAFRSMPAALTLLVATSPLVEFSLSTGTQSPVHLSLLLVTLYTGVWLLRMLLQRDLHLVPCAANRPLLLFNLAVLVSWVAGYAFWKPTVPQPGNAFFVQAGQVAMFVLSTALFFLAANHDLEEKHIRRWSGLIIAIGLVAIALDLLPGFHRPKGVNGSMLVWPLVLLWAQLLFNNTLSRQIRLLGWLSLPLWVVWFWLRAFIWKSGWVPALLALGVLLLLRSRALFAVFTVLLIIFVLLNWSVLFPATYLPEEQGGSFLRPPIWWDVLRMTARDPVFGLGPANYMYYWHDPTFASYSLEHTDWRAWFAIGYAPPSHNMFVDVIAQTGLVGLAFFLWAIVALLRLAGQARRRLPAGFLGAYAHGVLAGFAAMLVSSFVFADWLLPFVYNITIKGFQHSLYTWLLLGSLVPLLNHYGSSD